MLQDIIVSVKDRRLKGLSGVGGEVGDRNALLQKLEIRDAFSVLQIYCLFCKVLKVKPFPIYQLHNLYVEYICIYIICLYPKS